MAWFIFQPIGSRATITNACISTTGLAARLSNPGVPKAFPDGSAIRDG
jgi:hypothetical protein